MQLTDGLLVSKTSKNLSTAIISNLKQSREEIMTNANVTFRRLVQDSQDYGSNDEHMVSRAFFDLKIDDRAYQDLSVDIKQPVGSNFETSPLEISKPNGYNGPFNHQAFRDAVENYYRGLVGSSGSGIHISGGASNIRMRNNTFLQEVHVKFSVSKDGPAW